MSLSVTFLTSTVEDHTKYDTCSQINDLALFKLGVHYCLSITNLQV